MCLIADLFPFSFFLVVERCTEEDRVDMFSVTLFKGVAFARPEQVSALAGRLRCTEVMPN